MDTIVQWATILSPVIAVLLAWWTVRNSSQSVKQQIEAMQRNSEKEIAQLKELAKLEVEALSVKLDMELTQKSLAAQQADEERKGLQEVMSTTDMTFQDIALKRYQSQKPERDHRYMKAYIQGLDKLSKRLDVIKQKIN